MKHLLREPLVYFLLAGAIIFGITGLTAGDDADYRIVVTDAERARITDQWQAQMGRPPTPDELEGLLEQWLREEIYYREALRLGLDRNDVIIRRRLAQKLTFLTEDVATGVPPSSNDLRAFYDQHAERYVEPVRTTFRHRYFSTDRRDDARADAAAALADDSAEGDPFMLQRSYPRRSEREVGDLFGREFAQALFELPAADTWQGPIRSAYGWHVVKVEERIPARQPEFEEVAGKVAVDFERQRRADANAAYYDSLRERYRVEGL